MTFTKSDQQPENNYLTVSEYGAIVGKNVTISQSFEIELALARICGFGGIATLTTSDCTTATATAFPVALLEAVFELIAKLTPLTAVANLAPFNIEASDH